MNDSPSSELDAAFGQFAVDAEVFVEAPAIDVWRVVTEVERIGEFSPECIRVEWLGEPKGPVVGARFAGTNRWTIDRLPTAQRARLPADWTFEWTLPCEVTRAEAPRLFAYIVGDRFDGSPSTEWTFEMTTRGTGTVLREQMCHLASGRSFNRTEADKHPERAAQIIAERSAILRADLQRTLEMMRVAAERVSR